MNDLCVNRGSFYLLLNGRDARYDKLWENIKKIELPTMRTYSKAQH